MIEGFKASSAKLQKLVAMHLDATPWDILNAALILVEFDSDDYDKAARLLECLAHHIAMGGGGEFWADGYFTSTVEKHADETKIDRYIKA